MSLVPVPSEQDSATCANCGAALVADQRYCLSCGHPASPVRLAFLDVLQAERPRAGSAAQQWAPGETLDMTPVGYAPVFQQQGAGGWLRRNSGLMSLLSVLAMCLIIGLLVGHWVTQSNKAPGPQIVKVEGLSALGGASAAPSATGASSTPAPAAATPVESKTSAKEAAEAAKEAAKETKVEKAPPKAPVKVAPSKLEKLSKSSGKKHQEEINSLGAQPIETGG